MWLLANIIYYFTSRLKRKAVPTPSTTRSCARLRPTSCSTLPSTSNSSALWLWRPTWRSSSATRCPTLSFRQRFRCPSSDPTWLPLSATEITSRRRVPKFLTTGAIFKSSCYRYYLVKFSMQRFLQSSDQNLRLSLMSKLGLVESEVQVSPSELRCCLMYQCKCKTGTVWQLY